MRFVVIKKFKMSFKVVWHMVCGCLGWFGVVISGLSRDHRLLLNHYIFSSIDHRSCS